MADSKQYSTFFLNGLFLGVEVAGGADQLEEVGRRGVGFQKAARPLTKLGRNVAVAVVGPPGKLHQR